MNTPGTNAIAAIAIRRKNPCATLQEIGDKLNISRERVRQILAANHIPTQHWTPVRLCLQCRQPLSPDNICFCSRKCRHEYTSPLIICDNCGKTFRRWQHHLYNKSQSHFFCSRQCHGEYYRGKSYRSHLA